MTDKQKIIEQLNANRTGIVKNKYSFPTVVKMFKEPSLGTEKQRLALYQGDNNEEVGFVLYNEKDGLPTNRDIMFKDNKRYIIKELSKENNVILREALYICNTHQTPYVTNFSIIYLYCLWNYKVDINELIYGD